MYFIKDICCVCLKQTRSLQILESNWDSSRKRKCLPFYSKLVTFIPEMAHEKLEKHGMICLQCCKELNRVLTFRQQCLKNNQYYMNYMSTLSSIGDTNGELNICLKDFRKQKKRNNVNDFQSNFYKTNELIIESNNRYIVLNYKVKNVNKKIKKKINVVKNKSPKVHVSDVGCKKETDISARCIGNVTIKKVIETKTDYEDTNYIGNVTIRKVIDMKTENKDGGQEVKTVLEQKEEWNKGPSASPANFVPRTDELMLNNPKSDIFITEEIHIKSEPVDCTEYENILETALDSATEVNQDASESECMPLLRRCLTEKGTPLLSTDPLKPHVCDICHKAFTRKYDMFKHRRIHSGPFKCSKCPKEFTKRHFLNEHKLVHVGERPRRAHECQECGMKFVLRSNLNKHRLQHNADKRYKCTKCGKSFAKKSSLSNHNSTHNNEKSKHICEICNLACTTKSRLKQHKSVHLDKKLFKCDRCSKKFSLKKQLIRHKCIKTNKRTYICQECGEIFLNHLALSTHHLLHSDEKPFICEFCGRTFPKYASYLQHKLLHAGSKIVNCDICGFAYSRRQRMLEHRRIHNKPVVNGV